MDQPVEIELFTDLNGQLATVKSFWLTENQFYKVSDCFNFMNCTITVHPVVGLAISLIIVTFVYLVARLIIFVINSIKKLMNWIKSLSPDAVELNFPFGAGKVKITPTSEVKQIAHQAWTELKTRKVALPLEDDDIIVEVYNSWYTMFGIVRDLIKSIPASKLSDPNTKELSDILIKVLNLGLRPHLTKWQAKFRRWYDFALEKDKDRSKTPQQIQKEYPNYQELIVSMREVNGVMVEILKELEKLF